MEKKRLWKNVKYIKVYKYIRQKYNVFVSIRIVAVLAEDDGAREHDLRFHSRTSIVCTLRLVDFCSKSMLSQYCVLVVDVRPVRR